MKRTTVMLPDDVHARLRREARRHGVSVASLVRDALERDHPDLPAGERLSFFAIGEGPRDGSVRVDDYVRTAARRRRRA